MNSQLTQSFVPLTAAPVPPEKREFRVAVINGDANGASAEKKTAFQSLPMPAPLHGTEKKPCEPKVTVQRDGNRVTHLRIHCSCGQIMDLACVYDEAQAA